MWNPPHKYFRLVRFKPTGGEWLALDYRHDHTWDGYVVCIEQLRFGFWWRPVKNAGLYRTTQDAEAAISALNKGLLTKRGMVVAEYEVAA